MSEKNLLELQNEVFMALASASDEDLTPELIGRLDVMIDETTKNVATAKRVAEMLEKRRAVFVALRNEKASILKKRVIQ